MRTIHKLLLASVLLAGAVPAAAQAPVLYRLEPAASYSQGCLPPCLCPIAFTELLFGTFTLTFTGSDPQGFDHYAVDDVHWLLSFAGDQRVTGAGTYVRGGQVAVQHRLVLTLLVEGEAAPIVFDSGLVPAADPFPAVRLPIAQNGFFCLDRVFDVAASPVPAGEPTRYRMRRSLYEEGCYDPCDCPLARWRAIGTAFLVDLGGPAHDPALRHYALVDIDWRTIPAPAAHAYTGSGIYSLRTDTFEQRLTCDLVDQGGAQRRFTSGWVPGGMLFPNRLAIAMSVNGFFCADFAFFLGMRPG